jgi:hypothetical protein
MKYRPKLGIVTDMLDLNYREFLKTYYSGLKVVYEVYMMDDYICHWFDEVSGCDIIVMSPKTYNDYCLFVKKLEKETPLLMELR